MMGDEGQPNFSEMTAMKSASRFPSHWRKTLHASHVTRFACGPADEPITPMKLPQVQARCSCTFMPTIGEADGADEGGDEEKKSSCDMCAAWVDGTVACATPGGATLDENPSVDGIRDSSYEGLSQAVSCSDVRIVVERRQLFLLRGLLQHLNRD